MPTIMTHAVAAVALGGVTRFARRPPWFWLTTAALAMLPDIDVIAFPLGVSSRSVWGHRGITHSIPSAVVAGIAVAVGSRRTTSHAGAAALAPRASALRRILERVPLAAYFFAVTASHGVLDAFTSGGPGVAFLAPFDERRYFFPWRPIAVSPLGFGIFSGYGRHVLETELRWVCVPALLVSGAAAIVGRVVRRR